MTVGRSGAPVARVSGAGFRTTVRSMQYRPLGRTGMLVSELCLGNMMFGAIGNPDHDDCIRIIHKAFDHGINFVDTADVYSAGESEQITAKALAGARRESVILATKCHFPVDLGPFAADRKPNTWGNSRRHNLPPSRSRALGPLLHRPQPPRPSRSIRRRWSERGRRPARTARSSS